MLEQQKLTSIDKKKIELFDNLVAKLVPEDEQFTVSKSEPFAATWYLMTQMVKYFEELYLENNEYKQDSTGLSAGKYTKTNPLFYGDGGIYE